MSNYSILRIGPIVEDSNDCHATVIREAILSRFQEEDGASNTTSTTSTTSTNTNEKTALTISNRYFDANVMLLGTNESNTTNLNNEEEEVIAIEDGIMLIFDASLSTSFDILSTHHTTAVSNSKAGELLRLCIGTSYGPSPLSNGTKSSEEEYSRRVLWCLDHGYEYVEVDLTKEGMKRGFNDRDKDGFARVIEAIGSCMWSSHVMKPRNNVAVGSSRSSAGIKEKLESTSTTTETLATKEALPKNNDANTDISAKDNDKEEEELSETSTTASSLPDDYEEREKAAISSLMKDMNIEEQSSNPQQDQQQQQQHEDKKEEMAFHQLESVISEARLLREASKSNSMSDDERRARAGDTAMKLMGLLGSMGFDGDDSTDVEEEQCDSSDDEES